MWSAFPTSDYYELSAPCRGHQSATGLPTRPGTGCPGSVGPPAGFPRSLSTVRRDRHPAMPLHHRHGYAAGLHHGLPGRRHSPDRKFPTPSIERPAWPGSIDRGGCAVRPSPYPPGFGLVGALEGRSDTGSSRMPLRLASRARTIWQYWYDSSLSGPLSTFTPVPGIRLPSASSGTLRRPSGGVLSSPPDQTAPRGARCRLPIGDSVRRR
jgi:hypothetical protein